MGSEMCIRDSINTLTSLVHCLLWLHNCQLCDTLLCVPMGLVYHAEDTAFATRSTALYTNEQRRNLTFSFETFVNRMLCLQNMWIHRFSYPEPSACTHQGRCPYHLPYALDLLFLAQSYVYVVLEGQPSFMDASGRHAVTSRLPKGYGYHWDKLERTHTVSPLVKEAWTRCLVTLLHERDECQCQCIPFHVGVDLSLIHI